MVAHRCLVARVVCGTPEVGHAVDLEELHSVRQPVLAEVSFHPLPNKSKGFAVGWTKPRQNGVGLIPL